MNVHVRKKFLRENERIKYIITQQNQNWQLVPSKFPHPPPRSLSDSFL